VKRTTLGWTALALAGLLIAAGAAYAASKIATQPIGLSSEPISAGRALAPKATRPARPKPRRTATPRPKPKPTPTRTATAAPTSVPTAVPTTDDNGGSDSGGGGKGRDHPEDD